MSEDLQHQAEAMRRMWSSVMLLVLSDYWRAAAKPGADLAAIRRSALAYFASRDGREVLSLAGITVDPDRMADTAIDLAARDRTVAVRGEA